MRLLQTRFGRRSLPRRTRAQTAPSGPKGKANMLIVRVARWRSEARNLSQATLSR